MRLKAFTNKCNLSLLSHPPHFVNIIADVKTKCTVSTRTVGLQNSKTIVHMEASILVKRVDEQVLGSTTGSILCALIYY